MPATLEQTGTNVITSRTAFILRFISTIALWTIALLIMFSGYEVLFWMVISVFGMIGLWEFYRMLDHKGLPNFKVTGMIDRKSTRLNSSHLGISYAVFCLKKKKNNNIK